MTTVMAEPEWDQASRDAAMALALYDDSLCPLCGRPQWECQSGREFLADTPYRCGVTTARLQAQEATALPQPQALLWPVVERPAADDTEQEA